MVGFVEDSDELAFGFLDPAHVIRGCHLIPRFAMGRTNNLMPYQGPTVARPPGCTDDWTNLYVDTYAIQFFMSSGLVELTNRSPSFVDRDMFMRYYGWGVGHGDSVAGEKVTVGQGEALDENMDDQVTPEGLRVESDEGEDEDEDEDEDDGDADDPTNPGESLDEETANVY